MKLTANTDCTCAWINLFENVILIHLYSNAAHCSQRKSAEKTITIKITFKFQQNRLHCLCLYITKERRDQTTKKKEKQ